MAILVFGIVGTTTELLLLAHYEDAKQLIPLALMGTALIVLAWHAVSGRAASVRALKFMMLAFVGGGSVGVVLHYRGAMEFALETDPSLRGGKLFWKVMQAKAPPALAPGVMVQLGLVGLALAYRHPALRSPDDGTSSKGE